MGMTDSQFDSYKTQLMFNLERAQKEIAAITPDAKSETLDRIVESLRSELKKP